MRSGRNFILAVALWGCSQSANGGGGSGGTIGSGGSAATGSGGASVAGSSGSAAAGNGGTATASTGGTTGAAGSKATGGMPGTGGSTAASSGGNGSGGKSTAGTAGVTGSGGAKGGVTGNGGGSAGAAGSGGIPSTGGSVPAGGATGTAGGSPDAGRGDSAAGSVGGAGVGGDAGGGRGGGTAGATGTGGVSANGGASGGGSSGNEASFIPDPGWACGMADGIPPPTQGQLAFTVTLQIGATHEVGDTPYGHRRLLDVKGGTITGDKIKGSVVTGGLEYELTLSNGVVEFQGINILKTSDNAMIYVRSCGVAPDGSSTPRVIPDYEATTSGSYAWLNTGKLAATRVLDTSAGTLTLAVYDVSNVTVGTSRIQITKPSGVPKQPWDCNTTTGTKGSSVFTENVTLGSTVSIANAKRGSRNIIPITGGTTTGKVAGAILNGGADYQLASSSSTTLDAWYTLAPSNGEFILVRNCGPMGKLIPWFEARTDGNYNFLNANTFLSSDPGSGSGGVSITFYDRN